MNRFIWRRIKIQSKISLKLARKKESKVTQDVLVSNRKFIALGCLLLIRA